MLLEILITVVFYEFVTKPQQKIVLAASYGAQEAHSVGKNGTYCLSSLSLGAVCRLAKISQLQVRMGPYHSYVVQICAENTRVVLESVSK